MSSIPPPKLSDIADKIARSEAKLKYIIEDQKLGIFPTSTDPEYIAKLSSLQQLFLNSPVNQQRTALIRLGMNSSDTLLLGELSQENPLAYAKILSGISEEKNNWATAKTILGSLISGVILSLLGYYIYHSSPPSPPPASNPPLSSPTAVPQLENTLPSPSPSPPSGVVNESRIMSQVQDAILFSEIVSKKLKLNVPELETAATVTDAIIVLLKFEPYKMIMAENKDYVLWLYHLSTMYLIMQNPNQALQVLEAEPLITLRDCDLLLRKLAALKEIFINELRNPASRPREILGRMEEVLSLIESPVPGAEVPSLPVIRDSNEILGTAWLNFAFSSACEDRNKACREAFSYLRKARQSPISLNVLGVDAYLGLLLETDFCPVDIQEAVKMEIGSREKVIQRAQLELNNSLSVSELSLVVNALSAIRSLDEGCNPSDSTTIEILKSIVHRARQFPHFESAPVRKHAHFALMRLYLTRNGSNDEINAWEAAKEVLQAEDDIGESPWIFLSSISSVWMYSTQRRDEIKSIMLAKLNASSRSPNFWQSEDGALAGFSLIKLFHETNDPESLKYAKLLLDGGIAERLRVEGGAVEYSGLVVLAMALGSNSDYGNFKDKILPKALKYHSDHSLLDKSGNEGVDFWLCSYSLMTYLGSKPEAENCRSQLCSILQKELAKCQDFGLDQLRFKFCELVAGDQPAPRE